MLISEQETLCFQQMTLITGAFTATISHCRLQLINFKLFRNIIK